jgi:twitching motility protein PilU
MIIFDQALYDLFTEGEISYEDALKYADSANEVRLMIKLQGTDEQRRAVDRSIEAMALAGDPSERDQLGR